MEMITRLYIKTASRNRRTFLQNEYFTPPFKIADITENKSENILRLMLMSSSPGILDGDNHHIKIEVAKDCSLELLTQSYQRLFNMKNSAAQYIEVSLSENASFIYLPHPVVPHANSNFTARNKIYLEESCSLIWGEVLTCGRKLNGEAFLFSKYHSITEVFINRKLMLKENFLLQPLLTDVRKIGQLENFTHQASLIYINQPGNYNDLADKINDYLAQQNETDYGITTAQQTGLIIRILGYRAEQLHACLKTISGLLQTAFVKKDSVTLNPVGHAG